MSLHTTSFIAALLLAAGCGGAPAAAPATPAQALEHHEPEMSPPVAAFHDVIAPLWHAPEGAERTGKTCDAVGVFGDRAGAVAAAAKDAWRAEATQLVSSVGALKDACGGDRARFQDQFAAVHTAFHAVLEKSTAKP